MYTNMVADSLKTPLEMNLPGEGPLIILPFASALPFALETPLEREIAADPEWLAGVKWTQFHFEHPEGKVLDHIRDVLEAIDRLENDAIGDDRPRLRLIALIHDTLKYKAAWPQTRGEQRSHDDWAREFAERYLADEGFLTVLELHDEAFRASLLMTRRGDSEAADRRARELIARLGPHLPLFMRFYRCDQQLGDGSLPHYQWFRSEIRIQELADRLDS